jgi:hypothetical protein
MPYQQASHPQTTQANHETPSLTSIRPLELALKEEQEVSLELPFVPQNPQSRYSSDASQEDHTPVSLTSIQLQELALEEEQSFIEEYPVVPRISHCDSQSSGSLESKHALILALKKRPDCIYANLTHPKRSSIRPSKTKSLRGHAIRSSHGHGKANWIFLLVILSILSVVQALTDCQIMKNWLPEMFDGTGTACCLQPGISCKNGGWGRITGMYVA